MNEALMTIGEFAEMLGPDTQIKGAPGIGNFPPSVLIPGQSDPTGCFLLLKESGTAMSSFGLPLMRALLPQSSRTLCL